MFIEGECFWARTVEGDGREMSLSLLAEAGRRVREMGESMEIEGVPETRPDNIQTGGVIRTFCGHTYTVWAVSISPDHTTIASGSGDTTIHLWGTWTGECHCVIDGHNATVKFISFFPTNSQLLISASEDNTVQQWDISGHKIGPAYEGSGVAFSPDGIYFISWRYLGSVATVQNSDSGVVVAKLQVPSSCLRCCCFSPITKIVAGCAGHTIYIWDITSPGPHLVKTLIGHIKDIRSIAFSSSLISTSWDQSIKFWQIGTLPMDPVTTNPESTPLISGSIMFVSLQTADEIAISINKGGVLRVWDILTGLCKTSFHCPVDHYSINNMWPVDNRLILV